MSLLWKIIVGGIVTLLALTLLSWEYGQYPQFCDEHDKCVDHNLVYYLWLVIAKFFHEFESFFLVLFTACLAGFTWELRDSTEKLFKSGEKQIALVGLQVDLAAKQHGLQREEYFATHRPRVRLARARIIMTDGKPEAITFALINVGEGRITKVTWNAGVVILRDPGKMIGFHDFTLQQEHTIRFPLEDALNVGEATVQRLEFPLSSEIMAAIKNGTPHLHLIGSVSYEDTLGASRVMGFFRRYDSIRQRFVEVADTEYEYQD